MDLSPALGIREAEGCDLNPALTLHQDWMHTFGGPLIK